MQNGKYTAQDLAHRATMHIHNIKLFYNVHYFLISSEKRISKVFKRINTLTLRRGQCAHILSSGAGRILLSYLN